MALTDNLISYYKADANGSFPDAHGTNNGTISGATYTASGKINGAYDFDGTNDYVVIGTSGFPSGNSSRSFSLWANTDETATANKSMFSYGINALYQGWNIDNNSGNIIIQGYGNTASASATTALSAAAGWQHVVVTYDGTTIRYYVNGSAAGTATFPNTPNTATTSARIGGAIASWPGGAYFNGQVDEVGIWSRVLTSTEVGELYNSGSGLSYDSFGGATGWTGTINGVTNPAKINGIAVASISKVNGI